MSSYLTYHEAYGHDTVGRLGKRCSVDDHCIPGLVCHKSVNVPVEGTHGEFSNKHLGFCALGSQCKNAFRDPNSGSCVKKTHDGKLFPVGDGCCGPASQFMPNPHDPSADRYTREKYYSIPVQNSGNPHGPRTLCVKRTQLGHIVEVDPQLCHAIVDWTPEWQKFSKEQQYYGMWNHRIRYY